MPINAEALLAMFISGRELLTMILVDHHVPQLNEMRIEGQPQTRSFEMGRHSQTEEPTSKTFLYLKLQNAHDDLGWISIPIAFTRMILKGLSMKEC